MDANELSDHVARRLRETAANMDLLMEDIREVGRLQDLAQRLVAQPDAAQPDVIEECKRALERAEKDKRAAMECISAGRDVMAQAHTRPLQRT
jgi:hypothetical protein